METRVLPFTDEAIDEAARLILAGSPVAVPTETVYGLAADATNAEAVARIYEAKGRPSFNPLIVHVPDLETAERIGDFPPEAHSLADKHWPGPLTLVVPLRGDRRNCLDRDRRPADGRHSRSRPSRDAGSSPRCRAPSRCTVRERERLDQPDPRRTCAEKPGRPNRACDRRRTDRARSRIDDRCGDGWTAALAAARPDIDRGRAYPAESASKRRGSSPAIMRRPSRYGSIAHAEPTSISSALAPSPGTCQPEQHGRSRAGSRATVRPAPPGGCVR